MRLFPTRPASWCRQVMDDSAICFPTSTFFILALEIPYENINVDEGSLYNVCRIICHYHRICNRLVTLHLICSPAYLLALDNESPPNSTVPSSINTHLYP
jgi:hypothetical protein